MDLESFGLNTTFELIKKYMGDDTITCSHAEFFAAFCEEKKYDLYKNRVLKCERYCLLKNGYDADEVEKLVKEAADRIEFIKKQLTNEDIEGDMNYKIRKVVLNSSVGSDEKKEGINTRNDKFSAWLKENIKSLAKKEFKTNNKTEKEETQQDTTANKKFISNYSSLEEKKNRNTRVQIIFGDFDDTGKEDKAYNEELIEVKNDVVYGNEHLFFSMLKEQDNIAYTRLVDKVRYFSPAYHSMSPEGFNARLTFLHQCTRQGPTRTISNSNTNKANNLAFGRPPICILRLGNFLNTRVIINSMSISYPDSLWDINPEGIGMQFMMAKVQLGIDIIGGSDINGPVRELQNAVSFNFYANTSLYDSRGLVNGGNTEDNKSNDGGK